MDPIDQLEQSMRRREEAAPLREEVAFPASYLERVIGKPGREWSIQDLVDVVQDRGIRHVALMHIAGDGWLKTLDFVPASRSHLVDILAGGDRADGSSLFVGTGIRTGASDIILRPRPNRAFLDPFSLEPTLVVLCGHMGRDGKPLAESPDSIVRAAYRFLVEETGVDLHALGEVEFFLGKKPSDHDIYGADDRGYHASSPFVFGTELRRRALGILVEIGFPVKYGHSEVGYIEARDTDDLIWEQHEIELALTPLPDAAEGIVICQWVLRNLARQQGSRCLFDPIMRKGHAGSGLHVHLSPIVGERHAARPGRDGELPAEAKWLIGGLVQLGGALMAFGNRSGGSFVRLSQAKEAPNSVVWGRYDRNALVRIPIVATAEGGREVSAPTIEFRLPDGSAHPHLLLAGIAQAMMCGHDTADLDSVLAKTASGGPGEKFDLTPVPRSFDEVAAALDQYRSVLERNGVFPPSMLDSFLESLHT